MKAALIDPTNGLQVLEVPRPEPREGEVLVRMKCCGICGTDVEKVHGEGITTRILGHEEVGEVEQLGSGVRGVSVGERVFAHHHVGCVELCRLVVAVKDVQLATAVHRYADGATVLFNGVVLRLG